MATFNEDVLINGGLQVHGTDDVPQMEIRGTADQSLPLQTWAGSTGDPLAQVTSDGRLELGTLDMGSPDALVEANNAITFPPSAPLRGVQSLGRVTANSPQTLEDGIAWSVQELELLGNAVVSGIHTALRGRLTQQNTGDANESDLRAADFEAINEGGNSTQPVGRLVGVQSTVTNEVSGHLDEAVGIGITINDEGTSPVNTAYGLHIDSLPATANEAYAIHTGDGPVHLGDFVELKRPAAVPGQPMTDLIRVYPKSDGKLYAKNWNNQEFDLTDEGATSLAELSDVSAATQQPNRVLATPNGTTGAYRGRVLVADDIPNLDASKITSGVLNNEHIMWDSPSPIGSGSPNSGKFLSISISGPTSSPNLTFDAWEDGIARPINFKTAGDMRWSLRANPTDESGNNAGSDFDIIRYADDGTSLGVAQRITRSTGNVLFPNSVTVSGNVAIGGNLSKGSGSFRIDHPLQPTEKILYHGFVEAPRYDLIYRGTVVLAEGMATVDLDEASNMASGTWSALCQSPQLWLQNDTGFAPLRGVVDPAGKVFIECQDESSTDTVSWLVVAERKDPFIRTLELVDESGRLVPEQDKKLEGEEGEKLGSLLHQDAAERFNPNYQKG